SRACACPVVGMGAFYLHGDDLDGRAGLSGIRRCAPHLDDRGRFDCDRLRTLPAPSRNGARQDGTLRTGCLMIAEGAKFRPLHKLFHREGSLMATAKDRAQAKAGTGLNDDIGEQKRLALYRSQVRLREAEQRAYDLFLQNLVKGTSHLSLGQEAIAAGFAEAMQKGDLSFCTYRGHAHTLARGVPVEEVLGELMQRDNGLMRGKGGSMHLTSEEHGVMGSYAIIGAHLPIACGAAWRAQYKGDRDVSVCFFGDGTTNIGAFHEALNFAAVWKLPVIFVCENNLYMEYTPIGDVTAAPHTAADRAAGYALARGGASRATAGCRPRIGLWTRAHRHRWQRRRCRLSHGAGRLRQGACR